MAEAAYGRTRSGCIWHLLYEDDDQPALCGLGALRTQVWAETADKLPDTELVCANCTRVNERGNPHR
jgi:hypothetical protein